MSHTKTNYSILKKLYHYIKPYKFLFFILTCSAFLLSGLEVLRAYLFKIIIDDYILPKDYEGMLLLTLAMLALLFLEIGGTIFSTYYGFFLGQQIVKDLRERLFTSVVHFKMKYFDQSSVGILVTRCVNDIERIGEVFSEGLFEIFSDTLKMSVVIGVMLYTDWKLSLFILIIFPMVIFATNWFQTSMKNTFTEVRKQVAELNSFVQEHISGIKIVQLFTREQKEASLFKEINEKHQKAWLDNIFLNSVFFPLMDLATSVAVGLIVWYGGLKSALGDMQLGTMFLFIQLTQMLFRPLRHIADKFNSLQMGVVAAERVLNIIHSEKEHQQTEGTQELTIKKGEIRFENIHFGYKDEQEILKGISFQVKANETIAIVGTTGAGKSTIISLLTRFYDYQQGTIYIDEQDIQSVTLSSLRKHIGIVLQDVFLFSDTIFNNITLKNPDITEEEVREAAKFIGIHDFFEKLPEGYHYNVRERGLTLSAGQRQLIAFLRAFVHKPKILILDEATSSVDTTSEQLIQRAIATITKGRTSIIIAHRLSTIKNADKIIVLDKGKIMEIGKHEELLKIPNGYYTKLYEAGEKSSFL